MEVLDVLKMWAMKPVSYHHHELFSNKINKDAVVMGFNLAAAGGDGTITKWWSEIVRRWPYPDRKINNDSCACLEDPDG